MDDSSTKSYSDDYFGRVNDDFNPESSTTPHQGQDEHYDFSSIRNQPNNPLLSQPRYGHNQSDNSNDRHDRHDHHDHHYHHSNSNNNHNNHNDNHNSNNNINNNENENPNSSSNLLNMNDSNLNLNLNLNSRNINSSGGINVDSNLNGNNSSGNLNLKQQQNENQNQSHSHSQSGSQSQSQLVQQSHLQRKLHELEHDYLSKKLQYDIIYNRSEMMAKRMETKDLRIKNLTRELEKLQKQLTLKEENRLDLINKNEQLLQEQRMYTLSNNNTNGTNSHNISNFFERKEDDFSEMIDKVAKKQNEVSQDWNEMKQIVLKMCNDMENMEKDMKLIKNNIKSDQVVNDMICQNVSNVVSPLMNQLSKSLQTKFNVCIIDHRFGNCFCFLFLFCFCCFYNIFIFCFVNFVDFIDSDNVSKYATTAI